MGKLSCGGEQLMLQPYAFRMNSGFLMWLASKPEILFSSSLVLVLLNKPVCVLFYLSRRSPYQ